MKIRNSILLPAVCLLCSCSGGNEKMDKAGCAEAFAEAYGLVRWFYPGDMPEGFDWNEFALYGMREVLEWK